MKRNVKKMGPQRSQSEERQAEILRLASVLLAGSLVLWALSALPAAAETTDNSEDGPFSTHNDVSEDANECMPGSAEAKAGYCDPLETLKPRPVETSPKVYMPNQNPDHMVVEGEPSDFQKALSKSKKLDEFFNDERFIDEVRFARVMLRLDSYFREGRGVEIDPGTRFRFALPGAEKRFFLLLNGDFDRAINGDDSVVQETGVKNLLTPPEEEDASVALQAFVTATKKLNISIQAGARVRKWKPVGFVGPRYRQTFDVDPWLFRITQQVRWYTDEGFAVRSVLDIERQFSKRFFFRFTPHASWNEEDDTINYGTRAQLFHTLNDREMLEYQISWRADKEFDSRVIPNPAASVPGNPATLTVDPNHKLNNIVTRVRYRRSTPWPWLFVEAAPELAFREDRDYKPSPGIMIRLDTVFQVDW